MNNECLNVEMEDRSDRLWMHHLMLLCALLFVPLLHSNSKTSFINQSTNQTKRNGRQERNCYKFFRLQKNCHTSIYPPDRFLIYFLSFLYLSIFLFFCWRYTFSEMERLNESGYSGPDESGSSIMMVMLEVNMLPEASHKKMNTAPPLSFPMPIATPNHPDPRLGEEVYTPESSAEEEPREEEEDEEHTEAPAQEENDGGTAMSTPNEEEEEEEEKEKSTEEAISAPTPPREEVAETVVEKEREPEEQEVIFTDVPRKPTPPKDTATQKHDKEVQQPEHDEPVAEECVKPEGTSHLDDGLCSCPHDYTCARCGRFLNVSEPHNHDELPREPGPQPELARPRPASRKKTVPSEFAQDTELPQLQRSAAGGEGPRVVRRPVEREVPEVPEEEAPQEAEVEKETVEMKVEDDNRADAAVSEPVAEHPDVLYRPVEHKTVISACPHSFTCSYCGCVLNGSEPHDHEELPVEPGRTSELARPRPASCKKVVPQEFLQDTELPRLQRSVEVRGGSAVSRFPKGPANVEEGQHLQPHPPYEPRERCKTNPVRHCEGSRTQETPNKDADDTKLEVGEPIVDEAQEETLDGPYNTAPTDSHDGAHDGAHEEDPANDDMKEERTNENEIRSELEEIEADPVSEASEKEFPSGELNADDVERIEPVVMNEDAEVEERHYGGGPESRSEGRISVSSNANSAATASSHSEKQQLPYEERRQLLDAEAREVSNAVEELDSNGESVRSTAKEEAEPATESPKHRDMCTQAGHHNIQKARNLPPPVFDTEPAKEDRVNDEPSGEAEGSPEGIPQCADSPYAKGMRDQTPQDAPQIPEEEKEGEDDGELGSFSSSYSYSSWSSYSVITPSPEKKEKTKKSASGKGKHSGKRRTGSRLPPIHRSRNARTGSKKNPRQGARRSSTKKKKTGKNSKSSGEGAVPDLLMDSPYLQPVAGSPSRTKNTKPQGNAKSARNAGSTRRRGGDRKTSANVGNGNYGQEESVSPHRAAGDASSSSSRSDESQRNSLPPLPDSSLPKSNDPYAQILGRHGFWGESKYGGSR